MTGARAISTVTGVNHDSFWRTGRTTTENLFFALSMAVLVISFVAYFVLWKYKLLLFGWALCIALFATVWAARGARVNFAGVRLWPLLAFYGYLWLTAVWSYNPGLTLTWALYDLVFPAIFLLSVMWVRNLDVWRLSFFVELSVLLHVGIGLYFLATTGSIVDVRYGAIRSGMAFVFASSLPLLFWRWRARPSVPRALLIVWSIVVLPFVGSRSGLILLPIALAVSAYATVKSVRRPVYTLLLIVATGLVFFAGALATPAVREALQANLIRFSPAHQSLDLTDVAAELERPVEEQVDIDRRLQLFVALNTFIERPLLGGGYMNTLAQTTTLFNREISAHGLPATLLAETGLTGTFLFLLLLWPFFHGMRAASRAAAQLLDRSFFLAVSATMVLMLLFGLFHQLHQTPAFFVLLGWGYGVTHGNPAASATGARSNGLAGRNE